MTEGNQYDRIKPVPTGHRVDAQCGQIVLDALSTERMRELRLHHWKGVLFYRKKQTRLEHAYESCKEEYAKDNLKNHMEGAKHIANFHLGAVQLLNQFFPIGDYAENDVTTR